MRIYYRSCSVVFGFVILEHPLVGIGLKHLSGTGGQNKRAIGDDFGINKGTIS